MAATKASTTLSSSWASGSTTASGTTTAVSTATHYADTIYLTLVQVGVATTAATFTIWQSPDGTTYYAGPTYTAGLTAATYAWEIALDPTCQSVQVTWTTQSGGTSSTIAIQLGEVTGV